jgi:hypothetical protein
MKHFVPLDGSESKAGLSVLGLNRRQANKVSDSSSRELGVEVSFLFDAGDRMSRSVVECSCRAIFGVSLSSLS